MSYVFDLYFYKIPNYIIIPGYFILFPYQYLINGWVSVGQSLAGILICGGLLYLIYFIGGIGAGDVKLICLICGVIGVIDGIKFLILVFFAGAFIGIIKILVTYAPGNKGISTKISIRFTLPILLSYCVYILSKGGNYT